jgi:hypothetical protein
MFSGANGVTNARRFFRALGLRAIPAQGLAEGCTLIAESEKEE